MFLKIFGFAFILMATVSTFSQISYPVDKGVPQTLAKWRAENYSDVRYKLDLTIEKKAPTLKGTIEISLKSKTPQIILDWRKIRGHEKLSKVSNVSINGTKLRWNPRQPGAPNSKYPLYETHQEHIYINDGAKIGENVIKLDFESPILTSGSAITRYIDKEDGAEYIYSLFVPSDASTAFPIFDQPDLKARFQLTVSRPLKWKVITNSKSELANPYTVKVPGQFSEKLLIKQIFEETKPISTYVFAFAAGEFKNFDESETSEDITKFNPPRIEIIPLPNEDQDPKSSFITNVDIKEPGAKIYVRKSQAEKFKPHAKEIFRLNRESIKFFEEYFDYKFPFPKYDLVLIPEFPFGGMEHAGATFLRESSIIFPTEPTANNYISRASLLFHENAHQWFGDTVTMKWFDDLWLKEGFATFMAYKAMEKILPEYDAWKVFYERTKQRAYLTDVTKGTTPIYQEIPNLNSAKSAYGNIVYNKAPAFLKQAEFYLGEKEFKKAVQSFLKEHEFANAEWSDLVDSFEEASGRNLDEFANVWVKQKGLPKITIGKGNLHINNLAGKPRDAAVFYTLNQKDVLGEKGSWVMKTKVFIKLKNGETEIKDVNIFKRTRPRKRGFARYFMNLDIPNASPNLPVFIFPNYQDYGYGMFLLDEQSKRYIFENIQNEKDDFLRSMMWGALWDSVRFAELDPKDYVELAIKNIAVEKDVTTISSILGRVSIATTYYLSRDEINKLAPQIENLLFEKMKNSIEPGERITYYRAFVNNARSLAAKKALKEILKGERYVVRGTLTKIGGAVPGSAYVPSLPVLKTRDKFNIVTRLIVLGDKDAPKLLAELEKTEKSNAAKRYAYAAKAGFATKENKAKFWNDFVNNKEISESWIEAASGVWNSPQHSALTLPYLEKALAELPNHKQNRKIFFVNGWVASFIGGQKSEEALAKVNKFLADNPNLDADLKRKILERLDGLERAVKIREKYRK